MYKISNIYVLAAFGTLGGALFGFDVSSMSAWIGSEQFLEYFHSPDSNLQGIITAIMSAGSFVGAIAAGWISDYLGRRGALLIVSIIWVIGSVIQCSAQNVAHLMVGRVINGLAIGIASSQVCVYLAELAPGRIRGRVVGIQQWAIEWGILIMYLISWGCAQGIEGPAAFRVAWGVQAVPALVLGCALVCFPESPRWLAAKGRWEEAHDVLAMLHAQGDRDDVVVLEELAEVREAVRVAEEAKEATFVALFSRKLWRRTMCGLCVQMWQQLLGGNVDMYYVVYIFQMAGMSGNSSVTSSIIQYVIFVVTTGAILPILDRIPRRYLMITGSILCCILHFAIGGVMAAHGHWVPEVNGNKNLRWSIAGPPAKAVIALCYIFVGVYGFTWAPVGWIYCSEVFPLKYRAKGVGLSAATNWIFNFALAYFVSPSFTNIQWKTYIIFGVFCFVMTFHVYFMFPETAGRTLEEIDEVFEANTFTAYRTTKMGNELFARTVVESKQVELGGVATEHVEPKSETH